jgi:hypothetical protein
VEESEVPEDELTADKKEWVIMMKRKLINNFLKAVRLADTLR